MHFSLAVSSGELEFEAYDTVVAHRIDWDGKSSCLQQPTEMFEALNYWRLTGEERIIKKCVQMGYCLNIISDLRK